MGGYLVSHLSEVKLHDLAVPPLITEGHVEPNALLALQQVSERGRITNSFELLVLAKFSQLIKDNQWYNEANPLFTNHSAPTPEMLAAIKSLSQPDLLALAKSIYLTASIKNTAIPCCAPDMSVHDWIKLYTAREAND